MEALEKLTTILKCPDCRNSKILLKNNKLLECTNCKRSFCYNSDGILQMMPTRSLPQPRTYSDPDFIKWRKVFPEVYESRGYLQSIVDSSTHKWAAKAVAKTNRSGQNEWVLDLGCGTGDHFKYFELFDYVIGLDINLHALLQCKKKYRGALLVQADCNFLPFQPSIFSSVLALHVLEHFYYLEEAILEIQKVMANESFLYIGLPCEGGLLRDSLRAFTTERSNSRKYGIDYAKVARIEHCNTAKKVIEVLNKHFQLLRISFFPFSLLKSVNLNLTVSIEMEKRDSMRFYR